MSNNLVKNVLPAVAIIVAGVAGAYLVYDNYFNREQTVAVSTIEPAAGDAMTEHAAPVEGTAMTTESTATDTGAVDSVQGTTDAPTATMTTETDSAVTFKSGEDAKAMSGAAVETTTTTETKKEESKTETIH